MSEADTATPPLPPIPKLWDFSDPAKSEGRFRETVALAEKAGETGYALELLTQLARAQGLQAKYAEAHATLDGVEAKLTPTTPKARVRYFLERGRVFNSSGHPDKAEPCFRDAWQAAEAAHEDRLAVDAVHMIAIAKQNPDEQIEWNLRGIEVVKQRPAEKGWLYALYNNLGEAYCAKRDWLGALDTFQKLVALDLEAGDEPDLMALKDIGRALRKLERFEEATQVIRPIYDRLAKEGKTDPFIDEEMAELLLASGKADEARPIFARAYDGQRDNEWVLKTDPEKITRLKQLGGR